MPPWNPPNQNYDPNGPNGEPIISQYDLSIILKPCPSCGGVVQRIGSSSFSARCVGCSCQYDMNSGLRGLTVYPRSLFPVIPCFPPGYVPRNINPENYQQPNADNPPMNPAIASHAVGYNPMGLEWPLPTYIQPQ